MTYLQERHAAGEIVTGLALCRSRTGRPAPPHEHGVDAVQRAGRGGAVPRLGGAGEAERQPALILYESTTMMKITRRAAVGALAAAPLAMPGIIRAQSTSEAGANRVAQRHGRPVSRCRRPRQPARRRTGDRGFRRFGTRPADRGVAGRRSEQARRRERTGARVDRQPGRRCAGRWRRFVVGPRHPADRAREEAHLPDHRSGHVGHDRQAVLAVRHPLRLRHLRAGARHRRRADQGRRRYAGSSSPPTMRSATRWSATPSRRCRPPAARCSAR